VLLVVVLLMLGVGASAAFAGGGNSASAKLCQKTGWQSAQTGSGGAFASSEDCTSYAAEGGELFMPSLVQHLSSCFTFNGNGPFAIYTFNLSGFHPNSDVTFRLPNNPVPFPGVALTTDATGSASNPNVGVLYDPGSAAGFVATDAQGVHVEVDFIATC
jgi:hypothetical protein